MSIVDVELNNTHLQIWKSKARQPLGTTLLEKLSLLSPYTWWRVAVSKNHDDFLPVMTKCASALIIPLMMGHLYEMFRSKNRMDVKQFACQYYTTYLCSPYTFAILYKAGCQLKQVLLDVFQIYSMRSQANPQAWKCLAERIENSRAYRSRTFDLFVPAPTIFDAIPILFLPGFAVEHTSYAEIASLLSDSGYLVAVVSVEPLRLADGCLSGSSIFALREIQDFVEKYHSNNLKPNLLRSDWILAGHSMGSLVATKLAQPLGISKFIMLGSAPFVNVMGDVSTLPNCEVQVIQGSNDLIIQTFATPELTTEFWNRLPAGSKKNCHIIQGGTHSGFANYSSCWQKEVGGITYLEQHVEAVRVAVDFLSDRNSAPVKKAESTKSSLDPNQNTAI
jgi:Alpha/beta hydrolase family